ncbi:putative DnaJ domain, Chaperone J-domain superfamily [Helianthus annuus]|uniref:DnaJ domain, Chaperone J-domain superfamily n=1 Tax=Helianthus annuus TaxID=4232 RepID=A0A251TBK9_HELAN|nr:putative DnaJ domain, Chaperone J-domain superfamily [Helianthus annuus]KAJ0501845.1 putative DnaJ domain, Chaperone J-domain superfamily [Helianthus annuus]KAJ0509763.1 putative DnaJ domain, Chaperone J-domain superfamily [Helianthus annuus]KAJ0517772.1 putative DnaJ domain, Chaperone J-domain superfamily [Helianthus annuus]KAJ0685789.1 putative DnaJ domain, Chaperone J-domain superfamily [Helianthus annuus]
MMDCNVEEAIRAKQNAEKLFAVKDFVGAKQYAFKAQSICPQLEGVSQMVATFEIFAAAQKKDKGEINMYFVFGLTPSGDRSALKKQYKKLAVLLHLDKNKTVGADEAFKLVSKAWSVLSDSSKRTGMVEGLRVGLPATTHCVANILNLCM